MAVFQWGDDWIFRTGRKLENDPKAAKQWAVIHFPSQFIGYLVHRGNACPGTDIVWAVTVLAWFLERRQGRTDNWQWDKQQEARCLMGEKIRGCQHWETAEELSNFTFSRWIVVVQLHAGGKGDVSLFACMQHLVDLKAKIRTWYGAVVTVFLPRLDLSGPGGSLINLSANVPGSEHTKAANLLRKLINTVDMISKNLEQAAARAEIFPFALPGRTSAYVWEGRTV